MADKNGQAKFYRCNRCEAIVTADNVIAQGRRLVHATCKSVVNDVTAEVAKNTAVPGDCYD